MWSIERLRELAKERGENIPKNPDVERALLAQERMYGRAERDYDKHLALREMNAALDVIDGFPRLRAREFGGLTQLRAYAEERAVKREEDRKLVRQGEGGERTPLPENSEEELEDENELSQ